MKRIIITALIAAALAMPAMAQDFDQKEAIREQVSTAQATELSNAEANKTKAEEQLDQINAKLQQADKLRKQAEGLKKGKAKKLIKQAETLETPLYTQKIAAYNKIEKANAAIYIIYANDLKELQKNTSDKKKTAAISIAGEIQSAWDKAQDAIGKIPTGKGADPKTVAKLKEEANRYQAEAIGLQIQEYGMLLDWYGKEEDTREAEAAPVVSTPAAPQRPDRIIYKVQIAASFVPLDIRVLNNIYKSGNEPINNELENNMYKYSVGFYKTYDEAAAAKDKLGVRDAFIVAYKNGQKVDVNEAIRMEKQLGQ